MQPVIAYRLLPGLGVDVLDQTRLPHDEVWLEVRDVETMCEAIRSLRVRGAPFLGLMAACGMAIASTTRGAGDDVLRAAMTELLETRPTAVDLGTMAREALELALATSPAARVEVLWRHAQALAAGKDADDRAIGEHGAAELAFAKAVLTHCNTGTLATGGRGTALSVIRTAHKLGTLDRCFATETRPLLQGARLTMWELGKLGIPAALLPDTAVASLIASGQVQAVITGADRIARNGDAANKIGTLGLAIVARRYGIPFYIAAPGSTFDHECPTGAQIPIEFRSGDEVVAFAGVRSAPAGIDVYNPAFDVTPAELIAAIITESGVLHPPYAESVAAYLGVPGGSPQSK